VNISSAEIVCVFTDTFASSLVFVHFLPHIRHSDGITKRCIPNILRNTFAVENLLAGVPLDQVSLLLDHSNIKTTEKHYSPFVLARQDQLIASVKHAWPLMGIEHAV
jgi:site-specific recombinase XerD